MAGSAWAPLHAALTARRRLQQVLTCTCFLSEFTPSHTNELSVLARQCLLMFLHRHTQNDFITANNLGLLRLTEIAESERRERGKREERWGEK